MTGRALSIPKTPASGQEKPEPPTSQALEGGQALLTVQQRKTLEVYTSEVDSITEVSTSAPLKNAEQYARLSELLARGKAAWKGLEGTRKAAVGPLNAQVKEINGLFRPLLDSLDTLELRSKRLLLAWQQYEADERRRKQEEARRQQEEAAQREAEALRRVEAAKTAKAREKALADAEAASEAQIVAAIDEPMKPAPRGIRTDSGVSITKKRWVFSVVKPELVPREYCKVSDQAIRTAITNDVRKIPGVSITEEELLAVTAMRAG